MNSPYGKTSKFMDGLSDTTIVELAKRHAGRRGLLLVHSTVCVICCIVTMACLALLWSGCRTENMTGDAIVQTVAQYGGHKQTAASVPQLMCKWHVESSDADGFEARVSDVSFKDFNLFMEQVYGKPATVVGEPSHVYYHATNTGVGIEYFLYGKDIIFKCHRGVHVSPL